MPFQKEFEFALLNPQFRYLRYSQLSQKIADLRASPAASSYVYTVNSAVVEHGGIQDIEEIAARLNGLNITDILVSHEGSLTGAPIVCKNLANSFAHDGTPILISFGNNSAFTSLSNVILINFNSHSSRTAYWGYLLGLWLLDMGCITKNTKIVGSTLEVSNFLIGLCDAMNKGSCTLLHEHPYYYGYDRLEWLLAASQAVVYSSDYVLDGWRTTLKSEADIQFYHWKFTKQPQPIQSPITYHDNTTKITVKNYSPKYNDKIVISGAGHIQPRKGVHLFLEIAAEIARIIKSHPLHSERKIIATWVGLPDKTTEYSLYIISKANWLQRELPNLKVNLHPSCDDFIKFIRDSDIFLSTSTVDPLPNVVLDALSNGIPAFVMGGNNGHEEYFIENGLRQLVLPSNSIEKSAIACIDLVTSSPSHQDQIQKNILQLINGFPSQVEYTKIIREQATNANIVFDELVNSSRHLIKVGWETVLREYGSHFVSYQFPDRQTEYGAIVAGIHKYWGYPSKVMSPLTAKYDYRRLINKLFSQDLLAEIREECNDIAFMIDPAKSAGNTSLSYDAHIHCFYPDVCVEILNRIERLPIHPNNILITYPAQIAEEVSKLPSSTILDITLIQTPNIGRNIFPIKDIAMHASSDYIVHLHTKKSTHSDPTAIAKWNDYLLSTLIGNDSHSNLVTILNAMFSKSASVAYPLEPTYQQLGKNSAGINEIFQRLHKRNLLRPTLELNDDMFFPYPCGCMFIASNDFLRTMLIPMIDLINNDEVTEPLAYDGTLLHAAERCIPLIATSHKHLIGLILPPRGICR